MQTIDLIHFANPDELAHAAASAWLDELAHAKRAAKSYCVALSGGRITQKFFTAIVEQARARKIGDGGTPSLPSNVHFFWADERCVPPTDPESNFKMAQELLFAPLNISAANIHRLRGEDTPESAVNLAEIELRQIAAPDKNGLPVLDLILLGMGEDGHVASLFPNATPEILNCPTPFLVVKNSPKPPPLRLSLSHAAIAAAAKVWVLASGAGKESAFRESLSPSGQSPLAKVLQSRSATKVFSDLPA